MSICRVLVFLALFSQTFDVASIKPSPPNVGGRKGPPPFTTDPKRLAARGLTLKQLVARAYGVEEAFVSGGPAWADTDRYDVDASVESPATREQLLAMLQTLLADRFQLRFRRETKPVARYVLVVAKGGPKFGPRFHPTQGSTEKPHDGQLPLNGYTMEHLAFFLSDNRPSWDPEGESANGLPVLDGTGLTGTYDILLSHTSRQEFLSSLEQDLGLKLEARKTPAEILVIENAVKPAAN